MRNEVVPNAVAVTDPAIFEQKVTLARDIAGVLRKNIVQARRVEHDGRVPEGEDRWSAYDSDTSQVCGLTLNVVFGIRASHYGVHRIRLKR